jgi:hypothetical protein
VRLIVADTGPINYLVLIGSIDLLPILFEQVILPSAVQAELVNADAPLSVRSWIANSPAWLEVREPSGPQFELCGVAILRGAEEGEIWYLVEPESWGKGFATEAVRYLLSFGFGELGLHRIWATCLPENPASARVLEKAGMRKEGFLVKNLKIHGAWKSSFLYAILAEEWSRASSDSVPE